MDDAAPGRHQIHLARRDCLEGAEQIAMVDRAGEQIGHGGEVDMRMRADVDAVAGRQPGRPHLVEEDERPDRRPRLVGQRPVDLETAKIVGRGQQRLEKEVLAHGASSSG